MRIWLICLLVLCPVASSAAAIHDRHYNFDAELPPGFQAWPADQPLISIKTIHAFYKGDLTDDQPDTLIGIEHLGGVIGRERLDVAKIPGLPPGSHAKVEEAKWKSFDINVLVVHMVRNGIQIATVSAQVPLVPEAIQIHVAGPVETEPQLRGYLRYVLDSLKGESNWLSTSERLGRLVGGISTLVVVIGAVAGVIIIARRRRSPATQPMYPQTYAPAQGPAQPPGKNRPPPVRQVKPHEKPPWEQ
ncbi:MAG: hypothetical protein KDB82_01380 [Planctomycetes bacterium]|nr:hypothetical protein [Planctomycetota bacterium]